MSDRLTRFLGPVRVRITVAAATVFALASTLGAVAIVSSVRHSLESRARSDSIGALANVREQLEAGTDPRRIMIATGEPLAFTVLRNGQVVAGDPNVVFERSVGAAPPPGVSGGGVIYVQKTDESGLVTSQVVKTANGDFVVAVANPLETVRRSVDALVRALWFAIPALVGGVALLVWFLVGRALRPVEAIRAEVEDITHTTMHRRVPEPTSTDEVARLAHTMNRMLDRLEAAAARQRRFVSDASHELRSPIAAMRTDLEVGLRAGNETDWSATARRALVETDRLSHLVDDLLELARLDEGAARPYDDVDLDEVVVTDLAVRNGRIPVNAEAVSAGRVHGDARQLAQMVRNLVDNAVRHARSQVAVAVRIDGDDVLLLVDDDGDGVPEPERERIFERFARLDDGRARDAGGAGLGLALVQRVATAHGGTVSVMTSDLGGARFEVRLPTRGYQGIATPPFGRST
jgi:signal transduction histidine kinase